jgi:uncharacterized membrane protein YbhN (UPF0104 family)
MVRLMKLDVAVPGHFAGNLRSDSIFFLTTFASKLQPRKPFEVISLDDKTFPRGSVPKQDSAAHGASRLDQGSSMKYFGFLAKAGLSLGSLTLIFSRIDSAQIIDLMLKWTTFYGILAAFCALMIQSLLAAYRQIMILILLGYQISFMQSLRVWFSGLFITQVAVTFIAGDFIRGMQFTGVGVPRRVSGRAVVLDRLIGLAVLLLMVAATLPYVLSLAEDLHLRFSLMLLEAASVAGIFAILAVGFLPPLIAKLPWPLGQHRLIDIVVDLASVSRFLVTTPGRSLAIAGLSFIMHLLNVFGIVAIARSLGIEASLGDLAAVAIPVMLLAMLPISFAGWGVREAAMVTGMGLLQVSPSLALATSVSFGFSMILASLPGMLGLLHKDAKLRNAISFLKAPKID